MPSDKYSNAKGSPYLVRTAIRVHRPYLANTGEASDSTNLTEKERIARNIARSNKTANMGQLGGYGVGSGGFGGGGAGIGMGAAGSTVLSSQGNFYSYQLSTDFLEKPQSLRERRELFKAVYNSDEIVGQAIDLHTELPLSKVRLAAPKPRLAPEGFDGPEDYGKYILSRFENMCNDVKLFQRLITAVHHIWLDGHCVIFAEDSKVDVPLDVSNERRKVKKSFITDEGEAVEKEEEEWVENEDAGERDPVTGLTEAEFKYYQKHYKGWAKLLVLPIDKVKITTFDFTDEHILELIPSDKDRALLDRARQDDPVAQRLVEKIPEEMREYMMNGQLIPLGTDPDEGSFAAIITNNKSADTSIGQSIISRCLNTIIYRDKLRQAQTQIASRAMTPKRIVWAEGLSEIDVELLRQQVDLAMVDPDYSIVANYEVHWEEMGSKDRLLDLSSEYELTERLLLTGLGVTQSLMSGESLYSGDRLKLEVINQRYLHLREILQEYVENKLFKPIARRMGFVETDKWGQEAVLYPKLSFTRLPLRDSQDTFDALWNLYTKGSISIDLILEMLNIDPNDTRIKIEKDMMTVNDALFNEIWRSAYNEVGRMLAEKSDIVDKIAKYVGLKLKEEPEVPDEGNSRF